MIELRPIEDDEAVIIYESYREDKEPDSPKIPYSELPDEGKQSIASGYKRFALAASADEKLVGWVFIIDADDRPTINLGFSLLKEHRGKGLMVSIIKRAIEEIISRGHKRKITAGTATTNIAAKKSLLRAGFTQTGTEFHEWAPDIEYTEFELTAYSA